MVTRTLLYVTLYVHYLSCYKTSLGNLEKRNYWRETKLGIVTPVHKRHAMNLCGNISVPPGTLKLDAT